MDQLRKFSLGIGDRFAQQGVFQLEALLEASKLGVHISPVWNRSNREHQVLETNPLAVRQEADHAVKTLDWSDSYFVDADKITIDTVDKYISHANYFSVDVSGEIDRSADDKEINRLVEVCNDALGVATVDGVDDHEITTYELTAMAQKFCRAALAVKQVYDRILAERKVKDFAIEVSMDEAQVNQTPFEIYYMLLFLSKYQVPVDVIGPKFKGAFKKGVDYEDDVEAFANEFEHFILVIKHLIKNTNLPEQLKLVVHSGSDKFSIYPVMHELMIKHQVGIHLKTSGTTWLEELIGLAEAGGSYLEIAKSIYCVALNRYDITIQKYGNMLKIDLLKLPSAQDVMSWTSEQYCRALTHNQNDEAYNPHMRQLLHTAYKIAHEKGDAYLQAIAENKQLVGTKVKENLLNRHIKPLFLGQ